MSELWVKSASPGVRQPLSGHSAWPCLPVVPSIPALSLTHTSASASQQHWQFSAPDKGLLEIMPAEAFSLCVTAHPYKYLSVCDLCSGWHPGSHLLQTRLPLWPPACPFSLPLSSFSNDYLLKHYQLLNNGSMYS